jgi:Na+/melibiose symporter-like transporter
MEKRSSVSWWALLLAVEGFLLVLAIGIVLDAMGTSAGDTTGIRGMMLAAVIIGVGSFIIFLVSVLRADERGGPSAASARDRWNLVLIVGFEAIFTALGVGIVWDYNTATPPIAPSVLQAIMLVGALIYVFGFATWLMGLLAGDERASA